MSPFGAFSQPDSECGISLDRRVPSIALSTRLKIVPVTPAIEHLTPGDVCYVHPMTDHSPAGRDRAEYPAQARPLILSDNHLSHAGLCPMVAMAIIGD